MFQLLILVLTVISTSGIRPPSSADPRKNSSVIFNRTFKCGHSCNDKSTAKLFPPCSCGTDCASFGHCCLDAVNVSLSHQVTCQNTGRHGQHYYLVSSCATWWKNKEIEDYCLDPAYEDQFLNLPVSSEVTNNSYRNIYCGICNGDSDFIAWTIQSTFPPRDDRFQNCSIRNLCVLNFLPPGFIVDSKLLRSCDPYVIDRCPDDNEDLRCGVYFAPIQRINDSVIYKNEFCAYCNGVDQTNLKCDIKYQFIKQNTGIITPMLVRLSNSEFFPCYSILLDMDFINGGSVVVGESKKCPSSYVYDQWRRQCRRIIEICLNSGDGGACNADIEKVPHNASCTGLLYNDNQFSLEEGGTIRLLETNTLLTRSEYVSVNKSAIFVCFDITSVNYMNIGSGHGMVTLICICFSLFCLFIKIILYVCSKGTKKVSETVICYLSLSLFVAQLLFLVANKFRPIYPACVILAIAIHYAFLASFFWTNILSYDIWCTFSTFSSNNCSFSSTRLLKYSSFGWITPALIVLLAAMFDFVFPPTLARPNYGVPLCWISSRMALVIFFASPIAVLLIFNIYFYAATTMSIMNLSRDTKAVIKTSAARHKVEFFLYVKLALIMGLTWIIGFVAAFVPSEVLKFCFDALNSLQGIYILFAFTKFKSVASIKKRCSKQMSVISRVTETSIVSNYVQKQIM